MPQPPRQQPGQLDPTHSASSSRDVPTGIKIIAALNVIGALLALPVIGRILSQDHRLAGVIAIGVSILILAGLVVTYGLLTLEWWGWAGSLAFNGLAVFLGLGRSAAQMGDTGVTVLISGAIIFYLLTVGDHYSR